MFTNNQIQELRKKLQLGGAKDTSFPDAESLKGNELVTIVQEGINKKINIKDLIIEIAKGIEGGVIDPNSFDAAISAYEAQTAEAQVDYNDGLFDFKLGIPRGPKGDKGDKGDVGDTPVNTRTVLAFKSSVTTPDAPSGGSWNVATNTITYPNGWGPSDNLDRPVWMSTGIFSSLTPNNPTWSSPTLISGENGANGVDGLATEFVYRLTKTALEIPDITGVESPNTTGYVPNNWTASPSGISEEMQVEWVLTRKKDSDGTWSNWEGPVIWSKWGVNGIDGDGVEYIYKVNNGTSLSNPTPTDWETNTSYQAKDSEYVPSGWSNNPSGIDSTNTHEWVCVRKYRNGKWSEYKGPSLWAKYGENGDVGPAGISQRVMYAKTLSSDTSPVFVNDNINPGSIWGLTIPEYSSPEAIWAITTYVTYDNQLATITDKDGNEIYGWQGPILMSGIAGEDGTPPNYKVYIYKEASSKPNAPTDNAKLPDGWLDYPNTTGQWWQCIGTVNGVTELVESWSEVLPVNGQDGIAQDGKHWETRFCASSDYDTAPTINNALRNPSTTEYTWIKVDANNAPPTVPENGALWESMAEINPDDTLVSGWCPPFRISGERGPKGDTGPAGLQGVTGTPGVSIEVRYCLGTTASYDGSNAPTGYTPTGWSTSIPSITTAKPYIWCIQGRRSHVNVDDTAGTITWSTPFRLSGTNGINGDNGERGQLVYPAGIYSNTTTYSCTDKLAPYVLDTTDGNFYVLNAIMNWAGTSQNNLTPSQDYAKNGGKYWNRFEMFDAIYSAIGVFSQALVGSAVFYKDYVFSQQGIDANGEIVDTYENFNSDDPYNTSNSFRPALCLNLKTGEAWYSYGSIYLGADSDTNITIGDEIRDDLAIANGTFNAGSGTTIKNNKLAFSNGEIYFRAGSPNFYKEIFRLANIGTYANSTDARIRDLIKILSDGSGSIGDGSLSWTVSTDTANKKYTTVKLASGSAVFYDDGSGSIADGAITWDVNGNISIGDAIEFHNDGSGHLAYGDIEWDERGALTLRNPKQINSYQDGYVSGMPSNLNICYTNASIILPHPNDYLGQSFKFIWKYKTNSNGSISIASSSSDSIDKGYFLDGRALNTTHTIINYSGGTDNVSIFTATAIMWQGDYCWFIEASDANIQIE